MRGREHRNDALPGAGRGAPAAGPAPERLIAAQYAVSEILAAAPTVGHAIPRLLQALGEHLGWEAGVCWCRDADDRRLARTAVWAAPGIDADALAGDAGRSHARGEGIPGRVWELGAPLWDGDAHAGDAHAGDAHAGDGPARNGRQPLAGSVAAGRVGPPRAVLAFPIRSAATVFGVIELLDRGERAADDSLLQTVTAIGNQVGLFIERLRSERRLGDLLESMTEAFVAYDRGWRFTYANGPALEAFAASGAAGEVIGRTLWELFPSLDGTELGAAMRRAMDDRAASRLEVRSPAGDAWLQVRIYPTRDGIAANWSDITERRRAEDSARFLVEASAQLGGVLDVDAMIATLLRVAVPALGDCCVVHLVDAGGALRFADAAHVDPDRRALLHELEARFPPGDDAPDGATRVVRSGVSELATDAAAPGIDADPASTAERRELLRRIGIRSSLCVPLIARGVPLGALTIASTRRPLGPADLAVAEELGRRAALALDSARSYEAARHAGAAAAEANHAKTEFLTVMSHELRTPLNAIAGYTELLALGVQGPVTAEQLEALNRIQRSQRHLLALINDILNFARIESGRMPIELGTVSIAAIIAELEPLFAPQLGVRGLRYECVPSDGAPTAYADPEKVRQILVNLLSNAIKFTDLGGLVVVDWDADAEAVRIHVRDTGCGIPDGKLDRIFDPFVQLDRNFTSGHEGTGLGLAISRDLARAMGGDLTARSTIGLGSVFTLALPRAAAAPGPAPSQER